MIIVQMEKSSEEATGGEEAARVEDRGHRRLRKPYTPNRHSIGNVVIYISYKRVDVLQKVCGGVFVSAVEKKWN